MDGLTDAMRLLAREHGASSARGIGGDGSVGNPDVNQWLHGLGVLVREQPVQLRHGAEVHKAGVEIGPALAVVFPAQVPEWVDPVRVIEVSIDAEDLTEARPDIVGKGLREADVLADPITPSQRRLWRLEIVRPRGDGSLFGWRTETA